MKGRRMKLNLAIFMILSVAMAQSTLNAQIEFSRGERVVVVLGQKLADDESEELFWPGLALEVLETREITRPDGSLGQELRLQHFDRDGWVDSSQVKSPSDALQLFDKVLESNPDDESLLMAKGMTLVELKQPREALIVFDRLVERFPAILAYRNERAQCLTHLGEFDKALADFDHMIANNDGVEFRMNRALCRRLNGDIDGAREDLRFAIKLQPDQPASYLKLIELEASQQNNDGVSEVLGEMIAAFPADLRWLKMRAGFLAEIGMLEQARIDYEKMVELDGDNPDSHFVLAMFLRDSGQSKRALEKLNQMMVQFPDFWPAFLHGGLMLQRNGKHQQALEHLSRAMEMAGDVRHFVQYHRGCIYLDMGQPVDAIADFDAAIAVAPFPDAITRRGEAHQDLGNTQAALQDFNTVLEHDANHHSARILRADVHRKAGDEKAALADYDYLIQQGVHSGEVYFSRGHIRKRLKDWKGAIEDLTQAVAIDPQNYIYLNDLAWQMATVPDTTLRQPQTAIGYAQKACELSQWNSGAILDTLAVTYAAAGDFEKAIATSKQALEYIEPQYKQEVEDRLKLFSQHEPFVPN